MLVTHVLGFACNKTAVEDWRLKVMYISCLLQISMCRPPKTVLLYGRFSQVIGETRMLSHMFSNDLMAYAPNYLCKQEVQWLLDQGS